MSQFGLPRRSAMEDANAGTIDSPTVKTEVRDQELGKTKSLTSLDEGVSELGSSLGTALQKGLEEKAAYINETRTLEAVARQGTETGINETDKLKKRTGWEKFVFGENVEYRAAQQTAAANFVQARYMEEAVSIDEYAGDTEEEYKERLKAGMKGSLDKYQGDPETQAIVAAAWQAATGKLVAKHYQSRYAWNQMQQAEGVRVSISQTFDQANIEAEMATSPEEAELIRVNTMRIFTGKGFRKSGQTKEAYAGLVNDEVNNSLRAGNINAANLAKDSGWDSKLTTAERKARNQAYSNYDTKFGKELSTMLADGEVKALEAANIEDASAAYDVIDANLDGMEARLSGTEDGDMKLANARLRAAKGRRTALLSGAKARLKAERNQAMIDTWDNEKATDVGSAQAGLDMTIKDVDDSFDAWTLQRVSESQGREITAEEFSKLVFEKPELATAFAKMSEKAGIVSPMMVTVTNRVVSGYASLFDPEEHTATPEAINAINAIAKFSDNKEFRKKIGRDKANRLIMLRKGAQSGHDFEKIADDIKQFEENMSKVDIWNSKWPLHLKDGGTITKQQYVQGIVKGRTGTTPTPRSTARYMEEYQYGFNISGGDHPAAAEYVRKSIDDTTANVFGHAIFNGERLNHVSNHNYNFETVLQAGINAVAKPGELTLMQELIAEGVGNSKVEGGTFLRDINKLPSGYRMYVEPGQDGVYINSPDFRKPVYISQDILEAWDDKVEIAALNEKKAQAAKARADVKAFEAQVDNPQSRRFR